MSAIIRATSEGVLYVTCGHHRRLSQANVQRTLHSEATDEPAMPQPPPPAPEPAPLHCSECQRKITTCPGNVYGEQRHPTKITKDVEQSSKWKTIIENQPSSSRTDQTSDQRQIPGEFPKTLQQNPPTTSDAPPEPSEDEVEDILQCLAQEGGVKFLDHLLTKAVPHVDLEPLDTSNIREWTYKDIIRMPRVQQKEWKAVCHEELESLRRCDVYELVDPPKGSKITKKQMSLQSED